MQWDAVLFDFEDTLVDLSRGGSRKGPLYFNGAPGAPPVRDARGRPVMEAMLRLMESGVPVAVITSSPEAAMGRWFQEQQLCLSRPMTVVGFHDTVLHRPSPHPLIEALHQLGLPPSRRILSVGDGVADIEAARRAGVTAATVRPVTPLGMAADLYLPTVESFFDERLSFALAGDFESELSKTSLRGVSDEHEFLVGGRIRHRPSNRLTQLVDWSREGRWDEALVDLAETLVAHALGAQREDVLLTAVPPHRGQADRMSTLMARLRSRTGLHATPLLRFSRDPGRQATRERRARIDALEGCIESRGKHDLAGQTVVVIDDVRSSGATLREAARALLADGAARVVGIALAQEENRLADLASFGPLPSLTVVTSSDDVVASADDAVAELAPAGEVEAPASTTSVGEIDVDAEASEESEARRRVLGRVRVLGPGGRPDSEDQAPPAGAVVRSPLPPGFARPAGVLCAVGRALSDVATAAVSGARGVAPTTETSSRETIHDSRDVSDLAGLPDARGLSVTGGSATRGADPRDERASDEAPTSVRPPEPTTPAAIKARYPRAYRRWEPDEDARLGELYRAGEHDVLALADALGRQPAAVDSRIRRLGLDLDPALEDEEDGSDTTNDVAEAVTVAIGEEHDVESRRVDAQVLCEESVEPELLEPSVDAIDLTAPRTSVEDCVDDDEPVGGTETERAVEVEVALEADVDGASVIEDAYVVGSGTTVAVPTAEAERAPEPTTPAAIKARYPRAYQRWQPDEDARLRELFARGCELPELCDDLGRQPSAVDSRIRRLGLELPAIPGAASGSSSASTARSADSNAGAQAMLFATSRQAGSVDVPEPADVASSELSEADAGASAESAAVDVAPLPETPEAIKARYPRAYQRWRADEDARLRELHAQGLSLQEQCDALGRQPSAVDSRIRRLGLDLEPEPEVLECALPVDVPSHDQPHDAATAEEASVAERAPEPTTPEGIKARYSRAFQRWLPDEDARLRALHAQGLDVSALADALQRQPAAVESRIRRLGLDLALDDDGEELAEAD